MHSVIGYVVEDEYGSPAKHILIQPPEGKKFDYEAMHDINKLSITKLHEVGADREASLNLLLALVHREDVLVWYAPFVDKFLKQVMEEADNTALYNLIDVYKIAKESSLNPADYRLETVCDETGIDNLFDLKEYLERLPAAERKRRV